MGERESALVAAMAEWEKTAAAAVGTTADPAPAGNGVAGGVVARSAEKTYYADTRLAGPLSLNDKLSASGRFVMTVSGNNHVLVAHFAAGSKGPSHYAGVLSAEGPRLFAFVGLADGTRVLSPPLHVEHNVTYDWKYAYDPAGGADDPADADAAGEGLLTLDVSRDGKPLDTRAVDLDAAQRAKGAAFDAFGVSSDGVGGSGDANHAFVDDVTYAADAAGATRSQSFDQDPGWAGRGNAAG